MQVYSWRSPYTFFISLKNLAQLINYGRDINAEVAAKKQENVKKGYALAAEGLRYLADKISSIINDEELKVKNDLVKQGLIESVEQIRRKANRMDELYIKSEAPAALGRERFGGLSAEEWEEAQSMKRLICYALKVYGDDLSQTRETIFARIRTRYTNGDDLDFLSMEDIDRQLQIIDEAIVRDFCEK